MNILIVHEVDYCDKVIYEIHEFTELLARRGHRIIFIEFPESTVGFQRSKKRLIPGRVYESKFKLCTPVALNFGPLGRIFAIFSVVPLLLQILRTEKIDVILNYAVPTYGLQVLITSKLFKIPMVHRALDVSHLIRESNWNPFIKLYEWFFYRSLHHISANNRAMKDWITEFSKTGSEIEVHLPPLDMQKYSNPSVGKLRASLGIPESSLVFVYMGTFFYFSGLAEVIRAFAYSIRTNPDQSLLLIGGGEQDLALKSQVKALGIESKVFFTGFIEHQKLKDYIGVADIGINPLEISLMSDVALPHKVFQYLACGVPVISTALKGLRSLDLDVSSITWVETPSEVIPEYTKAMEIIANYDPQRIFRQLNFLSPSRTVKALEDYLKRVKGYLDE